MAVNVSRLSSKALKELKLGDRISIRYAQSQEEVDVGASRIIYEQFPKNVATAFSTKWAPLFPPTYNKNKSKPGGTTVLDLSCPPRTSVTVISTSSVPTIQKILTWTLDCCGGKGIQPFDTFATTPFYNSYLIKQAADDLGITVLSTQMLHRLNHIASIQIHSDDVHAMYRHLDPDHPLLKDIAAHIAHLIWTKQLKSQASYGALRRTISQFDRDVSACLDATRAAEQTLESNQASPVPSQPLQPDEPVTRIPPTSPRNHYPRRPTHRQWRSLPHPPRQPHPERSSSSSPSPSTSTPQPTPKTLRCPIIRKPHAGRPAYASLSLSELVDGDEYTGRR